MLAFHRRSSPTRRWRALSALVLLAGAAGCATHTADRYGTSAPQVPTAWAGPVLAAGPLPSVHWWEVTQDPVLAQLITQALARNADVQRALVRMEQAAAKAGLDQGGLFPMLQGYLFDSRQRYLHSSASETIYFNGIPIPISGFGGTQQSTSGNLTFSYVVDFWGTQRNAARASARALAAAADDVATARWLISTKVAEQYWTYAAAVAKQPLDAAEITAREADLHAAESREALATATLEEVSTARAQLDAARHQRSQDQADAGKALLALAVLLDEPPERFAPPAATLPADAVPNPPAELPAALLDRRPDVHSARLALDAALLRLKVARAAYYPSLNLQASVITGGSALKQILSNPLVSTGLQLALPILDWQDLRYRRALANADVHSAAVELRAKVYGALQDVELASALRAGTDEQLTAAARHAAELAALSAKLSVRAQYGYASTHELAEARGNESAAGRSLLEARLASWKNYLDIAKALGGPL